MGRVKDKYKIRTRFAPSPTGAFHIGGLRTALYSYALAKHTGGEFVLRIEDTDKKREVPGSREEIEKLLKDFSLEWNEHYVQSERVEGGIYKNAAEKLVESGHAFYCQCKPKNVKVEGFSKILRDPCRGKGYKKGAVKLKVPDGEAITYKDFVLGKVISWQTSVIADTTLLKSNGFPTYHLAVVVDDFDMKITHVLRGHDWLPSTPIHLLVYKNLWLKEPEIGHLTDILDPDGGKLSKRKRSVSVQGFLEEGYLHEALLNFVMLLGWAPKDDREMYALDEFVKAFDVDGFQKANPVFNRDKLVWFNCQYIKKTQNSKLKTKVWEFTGKKYSKETIGKTIPLVKERIKKLSEYESLAGFFFKKPKVDKKLFGKNYEKHLKTTIVALGTMRQWSNETLDKTLLGVVEKGEFKTGDFFMDLRVAICGSKVTPPINESIAILGKEETLSRLKNCLTVRSQSRPAKQLTSDM